MESAVTSTRSDLKAGLFDKSPRSANRTNSTGAPLDLTISTRRSNSAFGLRRESNSVHFSHGSLRGERDDPLRQKLHVGHRVLVVLRLPAEEERGVPLSAVRRERARFGQLGRVELGGPQRVGAVRVRPPTLGRQKDGVKTVGRPFGKAEIDVLRSQPPCERDVRGGGARAGGDDEVDLVGDRGRYRQWIERARLPADPVEELPEHAEGKQARERPLEAAGEAQRLADGQDASPRRRGISTARRGCRARNGRGRRRRPRGSESASPAPRRPVSVRASVIANARRSTASVEDA